MSLTYAYEIMTSFTVKGKWTLGLKRQNDEKRLIIKTHNLFKKIRLDQPHKKMNLKICTANFVSHLAKGKHDHCLNPKIKTCYCFFVLVPPARQHLFIFKHFFYRNFLYLPVYQLSVGMHVIVRPFFQRRVKVIKNSKGADGGGGGVIVNGQWSWK